MGTTGKIKEEYLVPLLEKIIASPILNFHTNNGTEYINKKVVNIVPGRGQKWLGYSHIRQEYAQHINSFYFDYFHEYLNFHCPCTYFTESIDSKCKVKKRYLYQNYETPYEKLKSIPDVEKFLKNGITLAMSDEAAYRYTGNEMAGKIQFERDKLFDKILVA